MKKQSQSCTDKHKIMMGIVSQVVSRKVEKVEKQLEDQKKKVLMLEQENITLNKQLNDTKKKLVETNTTLEKKIARQTLIPFGTEKIDKLITKQDIRDNFGLDAKGDVNLFRKIYITSIDPSVRSIRLKDYARRKVEIYTKESGWVSRDVKKIAEKFVKRVADDAYSEIVIAISRQKNAILRDEDMDEEDQRLEIAMIDNMNKHRSAHWARITNSNRYYMADVSRGIVDAIAHGK